MSSMVIDASQGVTAASTGSQSSATTGGGCVSAACVDGNPCTIDACVAGECAHTGRPPGEAGDLAEGPCDGVCQTDGKCGLSLYRRNLDQMTWSRTPLSLEWKGENAPPPRGVVAATAGGSFDYLVLVEDGMVYRRFDGAWIAPRVGTELMAVETKLVHAILYFSNSINSYTLWAPIDGVENQISYQISGTAVSLVYANPTGNTASLPIATHPVQWGLQLPNTDVLMRLADGNVYHYDIAGNFAPPITETTHFIWGDPATAPAPGTVIDAMLVLVGGNPEVQFIAP